MKSTPFQIILITVFVILIVGAFFLLFLDKGSSNQRDAVAISLWGVLPESHVQATLQAVNAEKNGLKVSYTQIDQNNFNQRLLEALASGKGPDAIIISQDMIVGYEDKISPISYQSISRRSFMDTYVPEAELFLSKDHVVGIPFAIDPLVTYWNRDIFSSAGISVPPQFWNDFLRLAESLTEKNGQVITKSAVSLGEFSNITNAKEIIGAMAFQSGVPIAYRSENGNVISALTTGGGETIKNVVDFYVEFANPVKSVYSWSRALPNSQSMFAQGNLGVYFGFTSELPAIKAKNPNLDFDLTYFPQPKSSNTKITFGKVYAISATRWSPKAADAMKLALFFGSQAGVKAWSDASGLPPVRRDLLSVTPSDPYAVIYYNSALQARGWLDPSYISTAGIFRDMIESVTSGWMTTSQAVEIAGAKLSNLLGGQ
ncbi:MAG TPA: ABC transporter substrate-binding protein [Candidatus Paceibacterota bacterium]